VWEVVSFRFIVVDKTLTKLDLSVQKLTAVTLNGGRNTNDVNKDLIGWNHGKIYEMRTENRYFYILRHQARNSIANI